MKNPFACAEFFHGTWAVFRSKRALTLHVAVLLGLLPTLFIGFFVNLSGGADDRTVIDISSAVLAIMAAACPLLAASDSTLFASATGAKTRREEFMAMPMGRLALPTAITALGALSFLLFTLTFLGAISLTLGFDALPDALASKPKMTWALPAMCAGAFVYVNGFCCLGNSPSLGVFLVPFVYGGLVLCTPIMGYELEGVLAFSVSHGVALGIYFLGLPFLLYARKRHHWTANKAHLDFVILFTALSSTLALGFLGVGWVLLLTLGAGTGAGIALKRKQQDVERRQRSNLRVAMIASAILLAPMGLVSLVNDCRYEASLAPVEGTLVAKLTHSPDDRFAAVELVPSLDISNDPARLLRRVAVVDLNGERAPKLFEPRFAHIGGWSEDGRYLAIQDRTLGRLHLEHDDVDFSSYWSALKSDLAQLPLRTLVYDTQTGTVQTLSVRVIRNGWRTPEDLLHIGATLGGDCALTLGTQGIEATLSRRRVRVPYTRDGKPVVRGERGEVFGWGADGLEPIEPIDPERTKQLARDRKKAKRLLGGWERKFTPFEPSSDALETASKKRRSRKTLTLTRGDQVVVLEPVYRAFDLKGVSDVVMIIDADGLKRVSLPDGDSSLVFASTGWIKFQSSPNVRKSRLAYDGAQWHRLDMQTGSSTPIDLGGLKGPTLLLGGRVIGTRGGGRYWIRDADGSTRSIFAPPALAAK